jgi:hypothetical protein
VRPLTRLREDQIPVPRDLRRSVQREYVTIPAVLA